MLELIAGKNRGSVVAALLDDADLIESAYKSAVDSTGSADEEFAKQQQSIEGHVNQLKNTWQTMWNDSLNSGVIKFFVDLAQAIVKVVDVAGILPTIFTTLSGITLWKNRDMLKMNFKEAFGGAVEAEKMANAVTRVQNVMQSGQASISAYAAAVRVLTAEQQAQVLTEQGLTEAQVAAALAKNQIAEADTLAAAAANAARIAKTGLTEAEIAEAFAAESANVAKQQELLANMELIDSEGQLDAARLKAMVTNGQLSETTAGLIMASQGFSAEMMEETGIIDANTAAKLANASANEQMSAAASARVFMNAQAEAKKFDQQIQAGKKQFDFDAAYGGFGTVITDNFKQAGTAATGFFGKIKAGATALKASIAGLSALSKVMLGFNAFLIGFQVVSSVINHFKQKQEEAYQELKNASQEYTNTAQSVEEYRSKVQELKESLSSGNLSQQEAYNTRKQLLELQNEMVSKYGSEANAINVLTSSVEQANAAFDELEAKQAKQYLSDNADKIEKATSKMEGAVKTTGAFGAKIGKIDTSNEYGSSIVDSLKQLAIKDGVNLEAKGLSGGEIKLKLHVTGDTREAQAAIESFRADVEQVATSLGTDVDSMLNLESGDFNKILSNALTQAKEIENTYGMIYDAQAEAKIKADSNLSAQVSNLQDIYAKIQEAQAAGSSGDVYQGVLDWSQAIGGVEENILNNANVDKSVKGYVQNMINEIEGTISQEKLELSMAVDFKQDSDTGKNMKNLINMFKDEFGNALSATDIQDIGRSWTAKDNEYTEATRTGKFDKAEQIRESFTEQEKAYKVLTDLAKYYGASVDDVLSAWINLGELAPGTGFLSKEMPDWSTETLSKNVDEYKTAQENVNKTVIDGQKISDGYYDSLSFYLQGVTIDGKKFSDVVDKENGNIVKNSKLLRQMVNAKRKDTQATINSAKAHAMLNYSDLTRDLQGHINMMATEFKTTGKVSEATLSNVDAIKDQIAAVKDMMREYAILELQVSDLTDGFREFEAAQARDEKLTYGDSMVSMLNTLNEGFQKGTVGTEAFQAAVKALVPDEVYEKADNYKQKLESIYDYLDNDEHFADYFTVGDDGIEITRQNVQNLLNDCKQLGLMTKQEDGAFEWTDKANVELSEVADQLGITKEAAVALFTEASKYDGTWSNSLSEILSSVPDREINNATEALENAVNAQEQFILDGGNVDSDEYAQLAQKAQQAADALEKAKQAAADNAGQWNQSSMVYDSFLGKMKLTNETATQLARNLGLIGGEETITVNDNGQIQLTDEQLKQLLANKNKLSEPSTVDIQMNYNEINDQISDLEAKIKAAKDSGGKEIDFGDAKLSIDDAESKLATLKEEAKNIEVNYDITKIDESAQAFVTKLENGVNVKLIPDTTEIDGILNGLDGGTVTTTFSEEGSAAVKQVASEINDIQMDDKETKFTSLGSDTVIGQASSVKSAIDNIPSSKTTTWSLKVDFSLGSVSSILGSLGGKHVEGTVSGDSNARGTAYAQGNAHIHGKLNGLKKDETNAVVGELGPEMVVDPYRGYYYTVGDNGTEMVNLPKGAIIYNHKQTEELLSQGKTSRGHLKGNLKLSDGIAMAQGNAHSYGNDFNLKPGFSNGSGKRPKTSNNTKSNNNSNKSTDNAAKATNNAAKSMDKAASATKDAADEFSEFIDWIDVLFTRLDNTIAEQEAILENKLSNIESIAKKTENYNKIMEKYAEEQTYSLQAAQKYQELANEKMSGLPQDIVTKIKNGSIDVTEYTDEDTVNNINDALDYLAKVSEYTKKSEESLTQIAETAKAQFEAQQQAYENQSSGDEHMNNMYETSNDILEAKMGFKTAKLIEQQIKQQQKLLDLYTQERKQLNETLILMVKAGKIQMGSQQWYDMKSAIEEVDEKILDAESSIEEFKNSLNDLHWDLFDELINRFNYVGDEISNVISLLDRKTDSLVKQDDVGALISKKNWATDEGITTIGLYAQEMERAQYVAKQYAKAIEELKSDYANGKYNETEYLSKLNELISGQYESIEKYYDAKDAIVELNEARVDAIKDGIDKEIDAYTELINRKKELLDAEKDLHDFQNTVADKEAEIAKIEKQLAAMAGDDTSATVAKRKELEAQLKEKQKDLEETYYDHSIDSQKEALDKELENFENEKNEEVKKWEEWLKDTDKVVDESLTMVKDKTNIVYDTLTDLGKQYGLTLSGSLISPWKDGENAISDYSSTFADAVSSFTGQLDNLVLGWQQVAKAAEDAAQAQIDALNRQEQEIGNPWANNNKTWTKDDFAPSNVSAATIHQVSSGGGNISKGDTVTLSKSATNFTRDGGNGTRIAEFAKGQSYTVYQTNGDEVLIGKNGVYTGWVKKSDLVGGSGGSTNANSSWADSSGKTIDDYAKDYNNAKARGDVEGMVAANNGANAIRKALGMSMSNSGQDIANIANQTNYGGTSANQVKNIYDRYSASEGTLSDATGRTVYDYAKEYDAAKARGDADGMQAASDAANAIRKANGLATQNAAADIANVRKTGGQGQAGTGGYYKVQSNGKAPAGLSVGDNVVTAGGIYKITGVNKNGSYTSEKVSEENIKAIDAVGKNVNNVKNTIDGTAQDIQGNLNINSSSIKQTLVDESSNVIASNGTVAGAVNNSRIANAMNTNTLANATLGVNEAIDESNVEIINTKDAVNGVKEASAENTQRIVNAIDAMAANMTTDEYDELYEEAVKQAQNTVKDSASKVAEKAKELMKDLIANAKKNGTTSDGGSSGGGGSSSSSGGNYTGTSNTSENNYTIGSSTGRDFVDNAKPGSTMTGGDGSKWTKNNDGSTTITKNGTTWKVPKNAKGTRSVPYDTLSLVDELGEELILRPNEHGRLDYLTKGTSVIPADMTDRLMALANNPSLAMENATPKTIVPNVSTSNVGITMNIDEVVHIDHADNNSIGNIQKAVTAQMDKYMQQVNGGLRRAVKSR